MSNLFLQDATASCLGRNKIRAPSDMALTNAQPSIAEHRAVMSLRYDCASSGVT